MKKHLLLLLAFITSLAAIQGCKKDKDNEPKIQTLEILAPSPAKVTFKGNIISTGSSKILDYGFIYNSISNIDESNGTKVSLGAEAKEGDFTKEVNSLTFNNQYNTSVLYARAYLTNEKGTVFGKVISVNMPLLTATNIAPQSGKSGEQVTISGQFFASSADQVIVTFNGVRAKVTEVTSSKIVVEVPSGINGVHGSQVPVQITIGGQRVNNNYYFTMMANVKDYSPKSGIIGTLITFSGDNLPVYYNTGNLRVYFGQTEGSINYTSSNAMQINLPVSVTAEKFQISILNNGQTTVLPGEFVVTPPTITSVSPTTVLPGSTIAITGTNFPTNYGYGTNPAVLIGSTAAYVSSVSSNSMYVNIPTTVTANDYTVSIKVGPHTVSASDKLKVLNHSISSFSPTSGAPGREVTLTGNFVSGQYYNVYFGSQQTYTQATSSTTMRATVPGFIDPGRVRVSLQYNSQNILAPGEFTILGPSLDSFTPASGVAGSIITISGSGFSTNSTSVRFGTINANILSVTENQIRVAVPSNLNLGAMKITVVSSGQTVVSSGNFTATN
ncbi:IPT/TIG domain-containing protein [Mucilaginibacter aquatilis]|uniref:IPT/TIG domain-containing protein n=1 Tax=Mucilaginibacter aquatilis TaxID=1517760 RepID=A0A6I4IE30_9SPHI|nr:IPT/TIG domain-containing protein [Mucilaginibacter aquatilis]MVN91619.1 hypothetical protein [Mucilaginibacter aquatilis]